MGTWAEGNFDNDTALDYLQGILGGLVERVEAILADKKRVALDQEGDEVLMPSVAIIAVLCEQCTDMVSPPELKVVRRWKDKFLKVFDKQIDEVVHEPNSPRGRAYISKRRKVITKTFEQLEKLSQKRWKKSG